jgi:putative phosphoesterase
MIGVISDTHDNLTAIRKAVRFFKDAGCSLVIHAGDFVAPFAARELAAAGCPVRAVYGNCDGEKAGLGRAIAPFGSIQEPPFAFRFDGLSFLVTHAGSVRELRPEAAKHDVIVFGHSHEPEVEKIGRALILNPGEAGGWLSGRSTVALLDLEALSAEIVPL